MNYAEELMEAVQREMDWPIPEAAEVPLVAMYALLARVKGEAVTAEDVHDAWALAAATSASDAPGYLRRDHWSLVPFADLDDGVKALDEPHAEDLRRVAGKVRAVS